MCSKIVGSDGGGDGTGFTGYKDPFDAALAPGAPKFFHELESGGDSCALGLLRNEAEVNIALAVVPASLEADVEDHLALVATALGVSRSLAMAYVDIGIQLQRMPRFLKVLRIRRHVPFAHLRAIASAMVPIRQETQIREIESRLASFVLPKVDGEALRGVRSLIRFMQKVVEELAPELRPRSLPGDGDSITALEAACGHKPGESVGFREEGAMTTVSMELEALRAFEFRETLLQIVKEKECTYAEALSHLVHGTAQPKVILNLYCPLTEEKPRTAWVGGHGWISEIATEFWLERVTGVRIMADETVSGYTPSQRQRAYVQGRDGVCSFPGCTVDAINCDIDHIEAYNHANPAEGGPTATQNLHCLCRAHHNLKTAGLWDIERHANGTEIWSSTTSGRKLIGHDEGPLAGHGRYSFNVRGLRIGQTLSEYNERREQLYEESQRLAEQARNSEDQDCPF